jgi:hypothetical protein
VSVLVSAGARVVAVAPGRERFLVDVPHPLLALEKFSRPQAMGDENWTLVQPPGGGLSVSLWPCTAVVISIAAIYNCGF